jgi:very-short-patch-repair endonuclease
VIELMDRRAESLPETRLRLGLLDRRVPPGVPQHRVVLLTGEHVRLDLAWPHAKVALEYDGPEHRTIAGQNRDAFRDGHLRDLGWDVTHVTSAMLLDAAAFDQLAGRVLRALG